MFPWNSSQSQDDGKSNYSKNPQQCYNLLRLTQGSKMDPEPSQLVLQVCKKKNSVSENICLRVGQNRPKFDQNTRKNYQDLIV